MEKLKFNKKQALEILRCKENTTNSRIRSKLEKLLNVDVISIGRADNVYFVANVEIEEVTDKETSNYYYYSTFRKYLVENDIIKSNTDYNKMLELINVYIQNRKDREVLTLDNLSRLLSISKSTLIKYNKILEDLCIINSLRNSEKKVIIKDSTTKEYSMLDYNYYYNFIINRMNYIVNKIKDIYCNEENNFKKVYFYSDLKGNIQALDERFGKIEYYIETMNYDLDDDAEEYEDYKLKTVTLDFIESTYINNNLYFIVLNILYEIHSIEELKVCRVRSITKEIDNDPDMMIVLNGAISYMNEFNYIKKTS